jgi:uncharacterized protein (TIGR00730 family)
MKTVCVMAGARGDAGMMDGARRIGSLLAMAGAYVWFGGSSKGMMGALAEGVLSSEGLITGVLPATIAKLGHYRKDIDIIVSEDMPARKAHFWKCDAFLCLPGGFGTLDELFEIATETKLGIVGQKPIVVYNPDDFYYGLGRQIDRMVRLGFMPQDRADLIQFRSTPEQAVEALGL